MQTATKFEAEGVDNGFPFCPPKVNVADRGDGSPYDYWTTLSGVSKDSPVASDALIAESLQLGMKLFWNLNEINCDAAYEDISGNINSVSSAIFEVFNESGSATEPKDRVCNTLGLQSSTTDPNNSNFPHAQIGSNRLNICRMYDGPTSSEDNFIGHGATLARPLNPRTTFIGCTGGAAGGFCSTVLGGYLNEENISSIAEDYQYVNMGSVGSPIWLTCAAVAQNSGSYSGTVDASLLISEITYTNGPTVRNGYAEITSLEFYTYPT